jgi:uncharacterized low-complexity protein
VIAVIVGGGFLALGVLGTLWISRGDTPLGPAEGSLMWGVVEVSGLQNIVHLVAGLALLVSGFVGLSAARLANLLVGTLLLALGLVALFTIGSSANLLGERDSLRRVSVAAGREPRCGQGSRGASPCHSLRHRRGASATELSALPQ